MNAWGFFAYLFQHFDQSFQVGVQALLQRMLAGAGTPLLSLLTLWIGGTTAVELYTGGGSGNPLIDLVRKMIRGTIVVTAIGAAAYNEIAATFLLSTLPNALVAAATGAAGGIAPDAFDTMFGQAWASGLRIYKTLSVWSSDGLGLMIVIAAFWLFCLGATTLAFLVFIVSHVLLGLVIAIGPICILGLLHPRTERIFNGWLGVVLSLCGTQFLVVGLLAMLMTVNTEIMHQIDVLNGGNLSDEFGQLHYLLEAGGLFFAMAYLTNRTPEIARAIFGGIAMHIAPITRIAGAAMTGGAQAIGRGINAAATGPVDTGAAGLRSITPTPMRPTP